MTNFAANNSALQKRIQQIWLPLFTPPPPKKGLSQEEQKAGHQKAVNNILDRAKKAAEKIRARGGKVVFLRLPSTGELRVLENKYSPRARIWDRLLETTAAPGIHFEDRPQLNEFDCPEWSHLNKKDATEFTRRLIPLLKKIRSKGEM